MVGVLGASGGFAAACCAPYGAVWRVWRAAWTHLGTILKAFSSILNYLRQILVVFDLTFLTVFMMDSAPGGHFALYFTIKSLNRAENRRRKRCRSKVLGLGLSGTALGRSGPVFGALKKAPRAYGTVWQFTTGLMQGGVWGPPESLLRRRIRNQDTKKTKPGDLNTPQSREFALHAQRGFLFGAPDDQTIRRI